VDRDGRLLLLQLKQELDQVRSRSGSGGKGGGEHRRRRSRRQKLKQGVERQVRRVWDRRRRPARRGVQLLCRGERRLLLLLVARG
jgi:hypothetical protein